jgi:hypothetical protein
MRTRLTRALGLRSGMGLRLALLALLVIPFMIFDTLPFWEGLPNPQIRRPLVRNQKTTNKMAAGVK